MTTASCPRCGAAITAAPDAHGLVRCPGCGVGLRAATPTPAPAAPRVPDAEPGTAAPHAPSAEALQAQLEALRHGQEEIHRVLGEVLTLLRSRPAAGSPAGVDPEGAFPDVGGEMPLPPPRPMRTRRRQKTVLLVDDDDASRGAVQAVFGRAQVPVRVVSDGNDAIAAMAAEKPDVLVLELGIAGSMPGKDVVNMIKATMEWVDVPIVLYTRLPIENQKEARSLHGADDLVRKGPGSVEVLVARVIQLFQAG